MRFILKGKAYELNKKEIEKRMEKISPEVIRKYYIVINGKKYPPKQVISEVVQLGRVEFTTMDAVNILRRLGFEIGHI